MSPAYLKELVNFKSSQYNFRKQDLASLPRLNGTRYGLRSFRYEAVKIWNSLPNKVRTAYSYPQFKRLLYSLDSVIFGCPFDLPSLYSSALFYF